VWVGGGVTFGPRPRDFTKKISKNTKALALRKALTERLKMGDVVIVDDLKLASAKTKDFVKVIDTLELTGTTLIVSCGAANANLTRAARNICGVTLTTGDSLNTYDVLRPDKLLFTKSAFETVEARLNKE
jgi:large subunit ribosomal protein L4